MRTTVRLTAALTLALAATAARAEFKLGYVDSQRAIAEVEEGKAAIALLKRDFEEKQRQVNVRTDELKRLQEDFQKQALIMTPEAKAARGAEIERKMMESQEFYVKLQQEMEGRQGDAMRPISDKLRAVVREIAEADGFAMVLDRNGAGIVYAPASLDLTNELIRKYNAKHPAAAAKKTDAPAPAKKADAPAPAPAKK